jgi:hypothetical protein
MIVYAKVKKSVCLVGPKNIALNEKSERVAGSAKHMHQFELQNNTFPEHEVTCGKTWVQNFNSK